MDTCILLIFLGVSPKPREKGKQNVSSTEIGSLIPGIKVLCTKTTFYAGVLTSHNCSMNVQCTFCEFSKVNVHKSPMCTASVHCEKNSSF